MSIFQFNRQGVYLVGLLLYVSVFFRTPIPIDETRYLSVAWEMWLRGDFLVPHLNGETYSHKPPLLFWLMQSGWAVFGVNEWWPCSIGTLAAFLNLYLTRHLATKLWPDKPEIAIYAPWILLATLLWTLFATSTMFDSLLSNCVLLGMLGLVLAEQGHDRKGWLFIALAISLGILTKGPVILIHLLPTALLVFLWKETPVSYAKWYGFGFLALLAGAAIALTWAIPAAIFGGEEYGKAILWSQTADRTVKTHIHVRPFWWYLEFILLLLFPWSFWPKLWQSVSITKIRSDKSLKFCTVWFIATLLIFSIIGSKQLHYLIPALPAFSLLAAALLHDFETQENLLQALIVPLVFILIGVFLIALPYIPGLSKLLWVQAVKPWWGFSVAIIGLSLLIFTYRQKQLSIIATSGAVVSAVFVGFIFFFQYNGSAYNLKPAALQVKAWQDAKIPVVFVDNYQGQFNFLARMTQPLTELTTEEAKTWALQHPNGHLITLEKNMPKLSEYQQLHRENRLIFRTAQQYIAEFIK